MKQIAAIALVCALAPGFAAAQSYQRVISFGDSLTDNGNLFATTGNPPSPPYNKRFTNGITFAEYLAGGTMLGFTSGATGPGSVNYAFGGARNDNGANSNGPIPSTLAQIGAFRARGGTFGANDVVTYWGGANNLFQSTAVAATNPLTAQAVVQADATAAGVASGTQVGGLAAAGAKTIVVMNLPDFGTIPAYTSLGAQGAALGSFATFAFNNAQAQALQAAAAANPGANIIQVDAGAALAAVIANPGAFGFSNATQPCFNAANLACAFSPKAVQNQYLFWDSVHPTDAGHALLAQVVGEYLYAPARTAGSAVLGEVGLWSRRSSSLDMLDKARSFIPKGEQIEYFVSVAGEHAGRNANFSSQQSIGGGLAGTSQTYKYSMGGLRVGGFKGLGNGYTGGFAVSALTGDASAGNVSASPTSLGVDLTGGWRQGPMFANALLGFGVDRYSDYKRKTALAAVTQQGSTDGISASATLEGGYDIAFGSLTVTPVARLAYLYTNVSGFDETAPFGSVSFAARSLQGLTGAVELRGTAKFSDTAAVTALLGYENFLTSSAQAVRGSLVNNTALPFVSYSGKPSGAGLIFGAGLEAGFGKWTTSISYRGSAGDKSQMTHTAELRAGMVW